MRGKRTSLWLMLAVLITSCATDLRNKELEKVAKDWSLVIRASQVIPVSASYPIFTAILAVIVLHERLTPRRIAGTALVIVGVIAVSI